MTAPDDLARTLGDEIARQYAGCDAAGEGYRPESKMLGRLLASVVSRRADIRTPDVLTDGGRPTVLDADLRTRIEAETWTKAADYMEQQAQVMREQRERVRKQKNSRDWPGSYLYDRENHRDEFRRRARALDGDTREDAPRRLCERCSINGAIYYHAKGEPCQGIIGQDDAARSRVPADTDTGR